MSGVTYTKAGEGYFEKRSLKRSAGVWGLWGLAVAAVISGDFSGWNFGIDFAGFGGMLIAFVILVAMYYGMIFSIGEMAAAHAAHRRRLLVRASGDGTAGAASSPVSPRPSSTSRPPA